MDMFLKNFDQKASCYHVGIVAQKNRHPNDESKST